MSAGEDTLIRMANQIAAFFESQGQATAAAQTADHLKKFWAPAMRRRIADHLATGGAGLSALASDAVASLARDDQVQISTSIQTIPASALRDGSS